MKKALFIVVALMGIILTQPAMAASRGCENEEQMYQMSSDICDEVCQPNGGLMSYECEVAFEGWVFTGTALHDCQLEHGEA